MKKELLIISIFCIFFSCESPFPNFKEIGNGNYMQLLSFTEESLKKEWNFVNADIKVFNQETIIYREYKENILPKDGLFKELIMNLNEGDSAVFMITKAYLINQFPNHDFKEIKEDYFKVFVKAHHFYNEQKKDIDKEIKEQIILKQYLQENNIAEDHKKGGIYIIPQKREKGKQIVSGVETRIKYTATFTNHLQFDELTKSFKLTYGTPDQVIKGLEIALKGMRKGEKSKIIIPSQFAFGEEGSSTGIVPPYTTVIYDLEIINVK